MQEAGVPLGSWYVFTTTTSSLLRQTTISIPFNCSSHLGYVRCKKNRQDNTDVIRFKCVTHQQYCADNDVCPHGIVKKVLDSDLYADVSAREICDGINLVSTCRIHLLLASLLLQITASLTVRVGVKMAEVV